MKKRCGPGLGGRLFGGPFWREDGEGGPRAPRGDAKFQILELLTEKSRHGYDIIRELEERNGGLYRPSPGSIYPNLQMLEDGGFVVSEQVGGKKVYSITPEGRQLLDQRPPTRERQDWADNGAARQSAVKLAGAVMQALRSRDPRIAAQVKQILDRGRKEIYGLLAAEDEDDE